LAAVALVLPPLLTIPAALGSMITSALVSVFPARRVREALMMIGALFVVLIVFLIRTQQPERLLNPRSIYDVGEFFSAFRTPASPLLPSTWATDILAAARHADPLPWFLLALLYSTAAATVVLGCWQARAFYWRGFSRAQEALPARFTALPLVDRFLEAITRPFELRFRSLLLKDLKTFLRDTTQWSQLFLLLALVMVYLYNFSVPRRTLPLRHSTCKTSSPSSISVSRASCSPRSRFDSCSPRFPSRDEPSGSSAARPYP
jgi:ABC-2 type transport system permease protein